MSNHLKVTTQETIRNLQQRGWSTRRIARELKLNRRTVRRYTESEPKCTTISISGSNADGPSKRTTNSIPGAEEETGAKCTTISNPGSERVLLADPDVLSEKKRPGRKSQCEPFASQIAAKLAHGLTAQRVHQDLVEEHAFTGSYQAVKRFVNKLRQTQPTPVARIECQPGEEMQVDFGLGARIEVGGEAKKRNSWVFRAVLSYSRKGYSEAVFGQDTETFVRCLENAMRHFGGVPVMLNLDNLKAAVIKADWFDPEINPKLADFCRHYGIYVMPCRARTPQHKGKVERGIAYVRDNALKGKTFPSLAEENRHLANWETNVADKRIHGTTRQQVEACFGVERPHLQALPTSLFPCYQEGRRSVHRDGYVEVQKAFYQAPPEFVGREVWVRWDGRVVRIFNDRMEQVRIHTRLEPGQFSSHRGVRGFQGPIQSSCRYWVRRAGVLGESCKQWAQAAMDERGPESLRSIMALCQLIEKHSALAINAACAKALESGLRRFRDIRRLVGEREQQSTFDFAGDHPLIRELSVYSEFMTTHHSSVQENLPAQEGEVNAQA
ncbi:unnamed protein product [uncultured bacterium]|nr:unnamed protein product [uncultured bacterium]